MEYKKAIDKLVLEKESGVMQFGMLGFDIHYVLNNQTDNLTNEKNPAVYRLTSNFRLSPSAGPDYSLSIWLWDGIPEKFKEVVMFHELKEAEARYSGGFDTCDAHKIASKFHIVYANKFLGKEDFKDFLKWQSKFKCYNIR